MNICPRCKADQPFYGVGWCLECGWTLILIQEGVSTENPFTGIPVQAPELVGVPEFRVSNEEIEALIRDSAQPPP